MYAFASFPVVSPSFTATPVRKLRKRSVRRYAPAVRASSDGSGNSDSDLSLFTSVRRLQTRPQNVRRCVQVHASSDDSSDDLSLTYQWMALNYRPWINSESDAEKCLNHLSKTENRVFDLERAKEVLDSVKADHNKQYQDRIPFELPKRYPGFLHILERSSVKR